MDLVSLVKNVIIHGRPGRGALQDDRF